MEAIAVGDVALDVEVGVRIALALMYQKLS